MRPTLDRFREAEVAREEAAEVPLDGQLESYVARALAASPRLRASFARWRASTERARGARRWPRPTLSYAAFLRPVETRVGPQRQKVGLRVPLAWPATLRAPQASAARRADAAGARFAAEFLLLRERVAAAYWQLWWLARRDAVLGEQLEILAGLLEAVEGRVATGGASVADLQQLALRRSRLADARAGLVEARARVEAGLRAALGLDADAALPVEGAPPALGAPAEAEATLREAAAARPEVAAHERLAEAAEAEIEGLRARRFPNVALGLDWIETGPARGGDPARSGDDPLILGVSVGLPVDLGADRALARAARAEGDAHRADAEAARRDAAAEVARALAEVRDARRRAALHEETLRPQAEAAFEATLGAYQAGRVGVAALMMALREQLEVELGLERARADFAVAWARLEAAVGRPVEARGDGDAPERDVVENGQGQGHGHGQGSEGGAR
ncbi:MAG TPA: TolC family protein [Polyangiaceae bacterium LLY-WYZ-15_(1-7)]|nr:TolC family protein [Polyangiaceae bacterium LLY-WYZ-15_(1-7)]HJL09692.1 TolC family protein [Polyangiaceae bacterium LLY-WYZ-15_(1-7)]